MSSDSSSPCVVLDTNVVLDWLVFRDAGVAALGQAITDGRLRWIASAAIRAELEHVLTCWRMPRYPVDTDAVLASLERHCQAVGREPPPAGPGLRCRDPDDQKFIDLAISLGAAGLITRDRAVLALRRRAFERHRLVIARPVDWSARWSAVAPE